MRINKYELTTEIAMLCDELEAYKRQAEDLQRMIDTCTQASSGEGLSAYDLLCINAGRKKIFDDCTNTYWNHVEASRDDETGAITCTRFEDYREKIYSRCPDSMSKRDFFEYFDAEFRAKYEDEKANAIAELDPQEGEDD